MDESLLDKLRSLGIQIGAREIPKPPVRPETDFKIEKILSMNVIDTQSGITFSKDEDFDANYVHGNLQFNSVIKSQIISEWAKIPTQSDSHENILFLDTETSGLAGGTGTFVFMIGLGYWQGGKFIVRQLFMRDPGVETAFLEGLEAISGSFDTVITFNGKSFDIPLLNTRYTLNALPSPFRNYNHIDLLTLSRQVWRNRLSDRSLGNLEREILEFEREEEDIPGWMIPEIYYDYLKSGDARPLAGVFYHNKIDILSLAALYIHTSHLLDNPIETSSQEGLDLIGIARVYERMGRMTDAANLYEKALEADLPRPFFIQTLYRFADIAKKNADWLVATYLWQKAVEYGEVDAAVELAKYYEHIKKDQEKALFWTRYAVNNLSNLPLPGYVTREKYQALQKRQVRLTKKQNKVDESVEERKQRDGKI